MREEGGKPVHKSVAQEWRLQEMGLSHGMKCSEEQRNV